MVVAFSGVFVACFYWTGRSFGLAAMFLSYFSIIFQIIVRLLHRMVRLFPAILITDRRVRTRLLCIYATALQISISKFQFLISCKIWTHFDGYSMTDKASGIK